MVKWVKLNTYYFTICAENRQKNIFVYGQHVYVLFYVETRFRFVVMAAKYELERGRQGGQGQQIIGCRINNLVFASL